MRSFRFLKAQILSGVNIARGRLEVLLMALLFGAYAVPDEQFIGIANSWKTCPSGVNLRP